MRKNLAIFCTALTAIILLIHATEAGAITRCNPANCTIVGTKKQCTDAWVYTQGPLSIGMTGTFNSATMCTLSVMTNTAIMINVVFKASRPTMATMANATCTFTGIWNNTGGSEPYTCTIDINDGLPVELMEFSVED